METLQRLPASQTIHVAGITEQNLQQCICHFTDLWENNVGLNMNKELPFHIVWYSSIETVPG